MKQNDKKLITNNERNSAIELLRIFTMIIIIFHHFAVHGAFTWNNELTIPHFWYNFIISGGKIGIDIFILISGYYLINATDQKHFIKKILKLWIQLVFYSSIIYIIFSIFENVSFNIKTFIKACLPVTFISWGFATNYFVLFLMHPFLNKMLHNIEKKQFQLMLIVFGILWGVVPTFIRYNYGSNYLFWLIFLYSLGSYIQIYGFNSKIKSKHFFILALISIIITYLASSTIFIFKTKYNFLTNIDIDFYGLQSITSLIITFFIFMSFNTLKMNYHKLINVIASTTFGIFLIHDNNYVRPWLWQKVFKVSMYQNSLLLIPYSILVVFIVFVICSFIEYIRQKLIEKSFMNLVNRYIDNLSKIGVKIFDVCKSIIFYE